MDKQAFISDFVNQRGSFGDMENFVDPADIRTMKFHVRASDECHTRAKDADTQSERERSRKLASWHLFRVDELLAKYSMSNGLKNPFERSTDEMVELLWQFTS